MLVYFWTFPWNMTSPNNHISHVTPLFWFGKLLHFMLFPSSTACLCCIRSGQSVSYSWGDHEKGPACVTGQIIKSRTSEVYQVSSYTLTSSRASIEDWPESNTGNDFQMWKIKLLLAICYGERGSQIDDWGWGWKIYMAVFCCWKIEIERKVSFENWNGWGSYGEVGGAGGWSLGWHRGKGYKVKINHFHQDQ